VESVTIDEKGDWPASARSRSQPSKLNSSDAR
jgi:hypothetical protein